MNKRIEKARKTLSLTRAAFGERMGVSGDVINNLERGRVETKEHMIILICEKFGINEEWLRTGKGEMFVTNEAESELATLTVDLLQEPSDSFRNRMIALMASMSEEEIRVIEGLMERFQKKE